jgi:hypothetical protein
MNDHSTMKYQLPTSIDIEILEIPENAEASIKSTSCGILTNSRAE